MSWLGLLGLLACGPAETSVPPEPEPEPAPVAAAQTSWPAELALAVPERAATVPVPVAKSAELTAARDKLDAVVRAEAVVDDHPWALGHALLAFGPELALPDGRSAVDQTFADYAEEVEVAGHTLVRFPARKGEVRVQPHAELLLKALTEIGVSPEREVTVEGQPHAVRELYLYALSQAWTDGAATGYSSYNDAPWALQGLATWAPDELAWTADGHAMSLDGFTSDLVAKLHADTAFMRDAVARGERFEKRGQGIFAYTCGGAHMLQGAMYAVARGYGTAEDKARVEAEIDVLFHRLPFEVQLVDGLLQQRPDYQVILVEQRLKFLGHWVETLYKAEAMGLFTPSADQRRQMEGAVAELVRTVLVIDTLGLYAKLDQVKAGNEQTYLDYVGDSAHALRALDLATGDGVVRY